MANFIKLGLLAWGLMATIQTTQRVEPDQAERVVVVSRHGDRAPFITVPWDEAHPQQPLWPFGLGQLTTAGKERMYRLGQWLRERYTKIFPTGYISPRDIYVRSTRIDRTLETAQLIAAGLSPPQGIWLWESPVGKLWQPTPIYTHDKNLDGLLYPDSKCVVADRYYEQIPASPEGVKFRKDYADIVDLIVQNTNMKVHDHRDIRDLLDVFISLDTHGYRLPHWMTTEALKRVRLAYVETFRLDFSSKVFPLTPYRTGMLLNEIIVRLESTSDRHRMSVFVTHDSMLVLLLDALGITLEKVIDYGTMIIFESRRSPNGDVVRIFLASMFRADDRLELATLHTQHCGKVDECLLTKLRSGLAPNLLADYAQWRTHCEGK